MGKVGVLKLREAITFAFVLVLVLSATAAGKPPTLEYGIIRNHDKAPPLPSTHPQPVNDPRRGCTAENYCRHFTLAVDNPSGTRFEARATVKVGARLNSRAPGTEAIAAAIAKWSLNHASVKSSRLLSVSVNSTACADSSEKLHLQAVSRGIVRMGLQVRSRNATMPKEDTSSLPPVGEITLKVDATSTKVELNFFTQVKSFRETDLIQILDYSKAILPTISN